MSTVMPIAPRAATPRSSHTLSSQATLEALNPELRYVLQRFEHLSRIFLILSLMLGLASTCALLYAGGLLRRALEQGSFLPMVLAFVPVLVLLPVGALLDRRLRAHYEPRVEAMRERLPLLEQEGIQAGLRDSRHAIWVLGPMMVLPFVTGVEDPDWSLALLAGVFALQCVGLAKMYAPFGRQWWLCALFMLLALPLALRGSVDRHPSEAWIFLSIMMAFMAYTCYDRWRILRRTLGGPPEASAPGDELTARAGVASTDAEGGNMSDVRAASTTSSDRRDPDGRSASGLRSLDVLDSELRFVAERYEQVCSVYLFPMAALAALVAIGSFYGLIVSGRLLELGALPTTLILVGPMTLLFVTGLLLDRRLQDRYQHRIEALRQSLTPKDRLAIQKGITQGRASAWLVLPAFAILLVTRLEPPHLVALGTALLFAALFEGMRRLRAPYGRHLRGLGLLALLVAGLTVVVPEDRVTILAVGACAVLSVLGFAWSGYEHCSLLRRTLDPRPETERSRHEPI